MLMVVLSSSPVTLLRTIVYNVVLLPGIQAKMVVATPDFLIIDEFEGSWLSKRVKIC